MTPDPRSQYRFSDYAKALRTHYRDFATDPESIRYIENVAASCEALQPRPDRFQQLQMRNFGSAMNAWHACRGTVPTGVASGYKGLLRIKTPFDLVLYQNLVWELRPKTILEFGSLQGGSGLWMSDLMDTYDIEGGEVHSFDLFSKCISPMAKHPRLHFHSCNLYELETLDDGLLSRLPHPWLVIDDAHVNVLDVTLKVDRHVQVGDYYVLEDIGLSPTIAFVEGLQKICAQGYSIDTDYADAFGYNVTSAPNGWLRKMHRA